jgi:hypothetical protein
VESDSRYSTITPIGIHTLMGPIWTPNIFQRLYRNSVYAVYQNMEDPLRFELDNGDCIIIPQFFPSDLGTIPIFLQFLVHKDSHSKEFILHDYIFAMHGVIVMNAQTKELVYREVSWTNANKILRDMIIKKQNIDSKIDSGIVFNGVMASSYAAWKRWRLKKKALMLIELCNNGFAGWDIYWPEPFPKSKCSARHRALC